MVDPPISFGGPVFYRYLFVFNCIMAAITAGRAAYFAVKKDARGTGIYTTLTVLGIMVAVMDILQMQATWAPSNT